MTTDCLAKIAAKTVECPKCNGVTGWDCTNCGDAGRVLDPRFKGLRKIHGELMGNNTSHPVYDDDGNCVDRVSCTSVGCKSYTVNPDLAVLLECTPADYELVQDLMFHISESMAVRYSAKQILEDAAQVVWEWKVAP